jgi:hypothetical protein
VKSEAGETLCIRRLHLPRFSVFSAVILIACAADSGCASRQAALRSPLALASRPRQTPPSPSDAAKRLDKEAQRLLKEMQKQRAGGGPSADTAQRSVGTAGRAGEIDGTVTSPTSPTSRMGGGSGTQPSMPANDVGAGTGPAASSQVSEESDSQPLSTSSSQTALLAGALAVLGAAAAAGVTLLRRRRA